MRIKRKKLRNIKVGVNDIYYIAFTIYLIVYTSRITMWGYEISTTMFDYAVIFMVFIKMILSHKISLRNFVLYALIVAVAIIIYSTTTFNTPIMIAIMLVGAEKTDYKRLVKLHLTICGIIVLAATVSSMLGFLQDRIFYSYFTSEIRHSMGMTYVTIWSSMVTCILLDYDILKYDSLKAYDIIINIVVMVFNYYWSRTRIELLTGILLIALLVLPDRIKESHLLKCIFVSSYPIGLAFSVITTFGYKINPSRYAALNYFSDNRITQAAKALSLYGIKPFGTYFATQGGGSVKFNQSIGYFFIDCFYMNVLLQYGIIFLLILSTIAIYLSIKEYKKNNYLMLLLFAIAAFKGIVVSCVFTYYLCPIFLYIFADVFAKKKKSIIHGTQSIKYEQKKNLLSQGMSYE